MSLPQLTLPIVGADYPNKRGPTRRFELALCEPGESVELRLEPENPADEHAVAVYSMRGVQLGYLPSQRAVRIGQIMRRGSEVSAIFQARASFGGYARIAFDGAAPVLPEEGEVRDPEPDWYPDEEWPDEP